MGEKKEIADLEGLIKDTIGGEVIEQNVISLLPPGENYGSIMNKVDFKVRKDGIEKEYHAVAKCTPLNALTQKIFNTQETFKGEIAWYTTVIPTYKQFQKDQGIQKELNCFQKYYGGRISLDPSSEKVDADGVILTENLKYIGYKNVDRHQGFDLLTTQAVLRDMATFHAIPLAIRRKNPELFDEKIAPYLNLFKGDDEEMQEFTKELVLMFDHIPSCEHLMDRVRKSIETSNEFDMTYREGPWVTVIHHDFWCNNVMVTEDDDPKSIILDLQTTVVGSPATDVIFLLLTSVQLDVIRDKIDYFLRYYYDQFTSQLKALGVAVEEFSYEGFLKEVDIVSRLGQYVHALGHTSMMMSEKGVSALDNSDVNATLQTPDLHSLKVNERHIRKFDWITVEAAKRNWI